MYDIWTVKNQDQAKGNNTTQFYWDDNDVYFYSENYYITATE